MMLYFVLTWCGLIISTANGQTAWACLTPNNEGAKCVSIRNCNILAKLVTTRLPHDVEFLRASQCGYSNGPLVCCGTANGYRNVTELAPGGKSEQTFNRSSLLPDRSSCGFQEGENRILGGLQTDLLEFPWLALLQYRKNDGSYTFSCSGVLINERYILTAAHCVIGRITEKIGTLAGVRLGEYDTATDIDCIPPGGDVCNRAPIDVEVEASFAHQDYDDNSMNRYHDIALIRLAQNVQLNEQIKAICLPTSSTERSVPGTMGYVAGWGRTERSNYSTKKLKVGLPIVPNHNCTYTYINANVEVVDTQLCAGGLAAQDSCNGDSGGPLMVTARNESAQWIAEGVVSFGTTCGTKDWPGIYTRVSEYLPWIYDNVKV